MSSDKRSLVKFSKFPGNIENDIWHFPTLYHIDSHKKVRIFDSYVRLIKKASMNSVSGIGWNLLSQDQIPIKAGYLKESVEETLAIPSGTVAQLWSETGIMGSVITRHEPTYFDQGVNIGKANERNLLKQALIKGRSNWMKRIDKGDSQVKPSQEDSDDEKDTADKPTKYFPMLLLKYSDKSDCIKFPCIVQYKLDGVRAVGYYDPGSDSVEFYSRNLKAFPGFSDFRKEMHSLLKSLYDSRNGESLYIDGEFYKHGLSLQEISGIVRNAEKNEGKTGLKFHMFDCFYPSKLNEPFEKRYKFLESTFGKLNNFTVVENFEAKNEKDISKLYKQAIHNKYEGIIVRNVSGKYLADPHHNGTKLRSCDVLKIKGHFSDEFEVVGFEQGSQGRDKGAIVWVCKVGDQTFNVVPKNTTIADRKALYDDAVKNFNDKYKGRMLTVEYEDISQAGVPLRAKSIGFRDE